MIQIDIDMPKQCGECPLCVNYDCVIHKRVTDEYYDTLEEQYAHCPLTMPSAQPEPLSDAYMKAVWTWLLNYQIKAVELKGRYTPYEVLSWVVNDWRKEHE